MNCLICRRELDQPDKPDTKNCGGDCLRCMAEVGDDPECIAEMDRISLNWRTEQ